MSEIALLHSQACLALRNRKGTADWCLPGNAHFVATVIGGDDAAQPILVAGANFPSTVRSEEKDPHLLEILPFEKPVCSTNVRREE